MEKIVDGKDPDGITSKVNWTGGGSFITFELKANNLNYYNDIVKANDSECVKLLETILNDPFALNYRCNAFEAKSDAGMEAFKALELDDKKKILFELIDANTLYVNYSDIDEQRFAIPEEDKKFMKSFYEVK